MRQEGHGTGTTRILFKKLQQRAAMNKPVRFQKKERNMDEKLKTQNARKTQNAEKCNVRATSNYSI
jgi:hypothetical protein